MAETDKTSIGDRMKAYEQPSTSRRAFKGQPLIVRLDGKNFHSFTKTCDKPYDAVLSGIMQRTLVELVDRYQATCGYTQSDEITLAWYIPVHSSTELPFAGRLQKIESLMSAYCTAYFLQEVMLHLPEKVKELPTFDARSFSVPTLTEGYHCFLWRQQDATKNAISMAAHSMFSHKSLQGLKGPDMMEKMFSEKGVNFNDYPSVFKRGIFAQREKYEVNLTEEILAKIPVGKRPDGPVIRSRVVLKDLWLSKLDDPIKDVFGTSPAHIA